LFQVAAGNFSGKSAEMTILESQLLREPIEDLLLPRNGRRSVPIMLVRAREAVMARFRPLLAEHGLSEQQWRVIRALAEAESLDAREVAERASVMAPSLTRIIRALQARRLVTRRIDQRDRRRVLLSLTPQGVELLAELTVKGSSGYSDFVAGYGAERIDRLLALLNELVDFCDMPAARRG
jgi:homoprotocatechuate degradation regulator HpaR